MIFNMIRAGWRFFWRIMFAVLLSAGFLMLVLSGEMRLMAGIADAIKNETKKQRDELNHSANLAEMLAAIKKDHWS